MSEITNPNILLPLEKWQYVIQFFVALGTCGTVFITLFLLLKKKKRFKIYDIRTEGELKGPLPKLKMHSAEILFDVKNLLEHDLQIYEVKLMFFNDKKQGESLVFSKPKNAIIEPLSFNTFSSSMSTQLNNQKEYIKKVYKAELYVKTSFGSKNIKLNHKEVKDILKIINHNFRSGENETNS